MKLFVFLIAGYFIAASDLCAQQDTTWFDFNWVATAKDRAFFYRPTPIKKEKLFVIKDYYLDGTLQFQGMSADTAREKAYEGECTWYNANGTIFSVQNYSKGKLHGYYARYYPNGKKMLELTYLNGDKHGKYTSWYSDGSIKIAGNYNHDSASGAWLYYSLNGEKTGVVNRD